MFGTETNYKLLFFQLATIGGCILASLLVKPLVFVVFAISVYAIRQKQDNIFFCQLFFILPFAMIYKWTPSSSSFFAYILLYYAFYLIIHDKVRLDNILILAVYLFLGSMDSIETWAKLVSGFVVLSYFVEISSQRDIRDYVVCFSVGLVVSSIVGLYKQDWPVLLLYFSDLNEELIGGEIIARFSGLYCDPNYYSISIIMAVYFLINFFVRNSINKLFFIVVTVTLIYFGFLTYSKIYMLSIVIVLVTQLRGYYSNSKYKVLTFFVVLIFAFFAVDSFLASDYFAKFTSRIDTDDISTNRFTIWSNYFGYLWNNTLSLLLGVGFSSSFYKGTAPHNSYIEGLYFLGIIGSSLYMFSLSRILGAKKLIVNRTWENYLILVVFMMMIGTLGVLTFNDIWLYYMLIWGAMNIDYNYKSIK